MPEFTRAEAKSWAQATVKDLYMCPLTPMTDSLELDAAGIAENIDAYVEMGLNGLVMGGFIAECWNLKLSDWMRYHEIVADANNGRLDLWTIILDPSVHQALEKMDFVESIGFNGAEVINPVVQLRTDDEIFDWFDYLTRHSDLAICLYRTPVSGTVLNSNLMARLADIDTVVAVKQGNMNRAESLKLRRELRDDFIVSDPFEYFYLDDLRNGGQVLWGELSYILYGKQRHLMRDYIKLGRAGKWEAAREKWAALAPVRQYYEDLFIWNIARTATYASALAAMKTWYKAIGLKAGPILPPVKNVEPARAAEITDRLIEMGVA